MPQSAPRPSTPTLPSSWASHYRVAKPPRLRFRRTCAASIGRGRHCGPGRPHRPGACAGGLRGVGIGAGVARGGACVLDQPGAMAELRSGDLIVATMTTAGHNAIFPMAAGLATAEGGLFSHAAILSREFDLPAVVG